MPSLFAIGDLHLAHSVDKPMHVFGEQWREHPAKIAKRWDAVVTADDLVLVCGDTSWAMRLDEAMPDLAYLAERPGRKLLVRGNHDYWWPGIGKLRSILPAGIEALQNDSIVFAGTGIAGTRGWVCPGSGMFRSPDDAKIYEREIQRLRLSLASASDTAVRIAILHYPPTNERKDPSGFSALMEEFRVDICVFGHLHGERAARGAHLSGRVRGTEYRLVSSDVVDFAPVRIWSAAEGILPVAA